MRSGWGGRLKKSWPILLGLIPAVMMLFVIVWPTERAQLGDPPGAPPGAASAGPPPRPYPSKLSRFIENARRAADSGERGSALEFLAKAQDSPPDERALAAIAMVYFDLKEYRRAEALIAPFVKEHPTNAQMRHRLALVYQALKDYEHALAILKQLSIEEPKNANYLIDLGICNFLNGSKEEAALNMRSAISLEPKRASAYLTLGAIYADQGRYEQALGSFDKALSLSPQPSDPLRLTILSSRSRLLAKKGGSKARP